MKTIVYVDGFNLYYGALKGTPYKWLDINKLCQLLLPKHTIHRIKYFTARVVGRPGDPDQPTRQQIFLRALETLPNVEIILGHFLSSETLMPFAISVNVSLFIDWKSRALSSMVLKNSLAKDFITRAIRGISGEASLELWSDVPQAHRVSTVPMSMIRASIVFQLPKFRVLASVRIPITRFLYRTRSPIKISTVPRK